MSYSNGITETIRLTGVALSAAGVKARLIGPEGAQGTVESIRAVVTTANNADQAINVGVAGDAAKHSTLTIPNGTAAGAGVNTSKDGLSPIITEDSVLEISAGGGGTAGAADVFVTINWF